MAQLPFFWLIQIALALLGIYILVYAEPNRKFLTHLAGGGIGFVLGAAITALILYAARGGSLADAELPALAVGLVWGVLGWFIYPAVQIAANFLFGFSLGFGLAGFVGYLTQSFIVVFLIALPLGILLGILGVKFHGFFSWLTIALMGLLLPAAGSFLPRNLNVPSLVFTPLFPGELGGFLDLLLIGAGTLLGALIFRLILGKKELPRLAGIRLETVLGVLPAVTVLLLILQAAPGALAASGLTRIPSYPLFLQLLTLDLLAALVFLLLARGQKKSPGGSPAKAPVSPREKLISLPALLGLTYLAQLLISPLLSSLTFGTGSYLSGVKGAFFSSLSPLILVELLLAGALIWLLSLGRQTAPGPNLKGKK